MSRALRLTPQNLGAKSEIAARADSLCRPARCSFLKKQAKNFSFALWSGGLRRACAKGWRTSAAQCLCSRIALWSGELALTLVQEAGARPRRRRRKVFAVRLQDVLAFFQKAGRVWDRVPRSRGCKGRRWIVFSGRNLAGVPPKRIKDSQSIPYGSSWKRPKASETSDGCFQNK